MSSLLSFQYHVRHLKNSHDMVTKHEVSTPGVSTSGLPPRGCSLHNTFYTAYVTVSDDCGDVARDSP